MAAALVLAMVCYVRDNEPQVPRHEYIAHGGGMIDSLHYTNSLEAIEQAVAHGATCIELDLVVSADSELIAHHICPDLATDYTTYPPSIAEFLSTPLIGVNGKTYTPLSWREINEYFLSHPQLTLVVDKLDDPKLLARYFPQLKHQMIVECFSVEHYVAVSQAGFKQAILSERAISMVDILLQDMKHLLDDDEPRIDLLGLSHYTYDESLSRRWQCRLLNLPLVVWTASNRSQADEFFEQTGARMVYCDNLTP